VNPLTRSNFEIIELIEQIKFKWRLKETLSVGRVWRSCKLWWRENTIFCRSHCMCCWARECTKLPLRVNHREVQQMNYRSLDLPSNGEYHSYTESENLSAAGKYNDTTESLENKGCSNLTISIQILAWGRDTGTIPMSPCHTLTTRWPANNSFKWRHEWPQMVTYWPRNTIFCRSTLSKVIEGNTGESFNRMIRPPKHKHDLP
jgi:hypothetical protein